LSSKNEGIGSILDNLQPGAIITVTTDSGDIIGPARFVLYSSSTGLLTLVEIGAVTPGDEVTIMVLASKIESIRFE
jgi:spore maturation protein CgeA